MSTYALDTLLALRQKAEEAAAQALARAAAATAAARQGQQSLEKAAATARRAWETERGRAAAGAEAAVDTVGQRRFADRLGATARSKSEKAAHHRASALAAAVRAEAGARQAYLTARQEREAVERHVDRQRAAERTVAARRLEDG